MRVEFASHTRALAVAHIYNGTSLRDSPMTKLRVSKGATVFEVPHYEALSSGEKILARLIFGLQFGTVFDLNTLDQVDDETRRVAYEALGIAWRLVPVGVSS